MIKLISGMVEFGGSKIYDGKVGILLIYVKLVEGVISLFILE